MNTRVGVVLGAALVAVLVVPSCGGAGPAGGDVPVITPEVLGEIPHDTSAFTQGLEFDGATLYESTGLVGRSQVRELDPVTGDVRRSAAAPPQYFGEGITVVGDRIWELTWQDGVAIEWDKHTLTPLREVPVDGEGWGLCRDGDRLIRSDGTDRLRFHDPTSFAEDGSVEVTRDGEPVRNLNELECVDGQVWANVWKTDHIVRIDPATGTVNAVIDASALVDAQGRITENVLNGIAHIDSDEYLLTGKNWPTAYRVRIDAPE
ncbi:glutaminyl-peptide cyclotransferase [Mycolicibacterium sp. XJ1819]